MRLLKALTALGIGLFVAANHTSFGARGGHQIHGSWQMLSSRPAVGPVLTGQGVPGISSISHVPSHALHGEHPPTLSATAAKKASQFDTLLKNNAFSKRNLAGTLAGRSGGRRSNSGPQCGCAQNRQNAQRLAQSGSAKSQTMGSSTGQKASTPAKSTGRAKALAARGSMHPTNSGTRTAPHNLSSTRNMAPRSVQPTPPVPQQLPSPPPPHQTTASLHRPATKR